MIQIKSNSWMVFDEITTLYKSEAVSIFFIQKESYNNQEILIETLELLLKILGFI